MNLITYLIDEVENIEERISKLTEEVLEAIEYSDGEMNKVLTFTLINLQVSRNVLLDILKNLKAYHELTMKSLIETEIKA